MTTAGCFPSVSKIPEVSRGQMLEVDRLMIEDYQISLLQMMENAGRALALVAKDIFLDGNASGARIAVLTGSGGNGGGASTAARRLANWGAKIELGMARASEDLTNVPKQQFTILSEIAAPREFEPDGLPDCDLIIDGLIGYSLNGAPRGKSADFIQAANAKGTPILSLDVPSGYDAQAGLALFPAVCASATLTLALPKTGMLKAGNAKNVGQLFCADLSVPPKLYASMHLPAQAGEIFLQNDIVRLS